MTAVFTPFEKRALIYLARSALESAVRGLPLPPVSYSGPPARLTCPGACFVTLSAGRRLRGCMGALEAHQPLYADVRQRAVEAGFSDHRFQPVSARELPGLDIEISVLSEPAALAYQRPSELPPLLRPRVDGVILQLGKSRATFLPQVWEHVSDPARFLGLLCDKLGLPADTWRQILLEVYVYQVESFSESQINAEPGLD